MRRSCVAALTVVWGFVFLGSVALGQQDIVRLTSGDVLVGEITAENDEQVNLSHPVLGDLVLPRERISTVERHAEAPHVEVPAEVELPTPPAAEPDAPEPVRPGLLGTPFLRGWERTLEAGFSGSDGNTRTLDLRAGFAAMYEDDYDRWLAALSYYRATSGGTTTRNEFDASLTKDWLFPERPYFLFATGTYEYDQFAGYEHRVSAFGGVGYQFIEDEKWNLRGRAGVGGNYEFGNVNEFTPEAMLGVEVAYRFNEDHVISAYNTFFPALDDFGEFRNNTGVAWTIRIDRDHGLSLRLGVENEYQSEVEPSSKRYDLRYFGSLLFEF